MLEIEFTFPDWEGRLERKRGELMRFQAAIIQENRGQLFDSEGSFNGHEGWAPLGMRSGQILSDRGRLRKSLMGQGNGRAGPGGAVDFAGDVISIGTTLGYAKMMNYGTTKLPGGVLRPKRAKALKIPIPSGQNANTNARNLRASKARTRLAKAQQQLSATEAKANKRKAEFEQRGDEGSMTRAVASERTRLNRRAAVQRLQAQVSKIMATGKGGQGFIFRKWVRIPPRDFISWNSQDQTQLNAALMRKIVQVLNGED